MMDRYLKTQDRAMALTTWEEGRKRVELCKSDKERERGEKRAFCHQVRETMRKQNITPGTKRGGEESRKDRAEERGKGL